MALPRTHGPALLATKRQVFHELGKVHVGVEQVGFFKILRGFVSFCGFRDVGYLVRVTLVPLAADGLND